MATGDPVCTAHGALLPCGECLRGVGQSFHGNPSPREVLNAGRCRACGTEINPATGTCLGNPHHYVGPTFTFRTGEGPMNNPNNVTELPENRVAQTPYHAYGPIVATTAREVALLKRCVALERVLTPIVKFHRALPVSPPEPVEVAVPQQKVAEAADVLDFGWWIQEGF